MTVGRAPSALTAFFSNTLKFRGLNAKYKTALLAADKDGSVSKPKFHPYYLTHVQDEDAALKILDDLNMSRKEFNEMITYQEDIYRMTQPIGATVLCGGLSLLGFPFWANATHRHPSTFFSTEAEIRAGGIARDQEFAIKHAPQTNHQQHRYLEFYLNGEASHNEAFDSIANGFASPKNIAAIRKLGQAVSKQGSSSMMFSSSDISSWKRDREHYHFAAFMGHPFALHSNETLVSRTLAHFRNLFQEDALIKKEGVASLTDLELYQACSARKVARWEEELNRTQLEARLQDWFTLTERKAGEPVVPLRVIVMYQTSLFRDPGYLDQTLEDLDKDIYNSSFAYAADAFERRVEFETGPYAEHVKAHMEKVTANEAKLTEERSKFLSGSA